MPLNVTKADDPLRVENLVVTLYGPPGVGKTTIGFSAHRPLLLDFDRGAHRAKVRRDSVQVQHWRDVVDITEDDVAGYGTIVVDTAGRALEVLGADIIRRNPKMGRGGTLTLQGYGQLKSEFAAWVKHLRQLHRDVLLIAHASEDARGDDLVERIDMQGASKQEVYKISDAMGRLTVVRGQKLPQLTFSPSDAAFGKNPGELDEVTVPNIEQAPDFFGGLMDTIKERINAMTEEQKRRQDAIEEWVAKVRAADTADAVNALIPEVNAADETIRNIVRGALKNHAQDTLGLQYSRSAEGYVAPAGSEGEASDGESADTAGDASKGSDKGKGKSAAKGKGKSAGGES